MIKRVRLAWFWLRSRFAPQNAYVRCETCPHWIFHSRVKESNVVVEIVSGLLDPAALDYRAGICALDKPKVFNDFTTGFAFKAWTALDWCRRHPLFEPNIVQGSSLQYRPGEDTLGNAGFDRLPTFREAVAMAMKGDTMPETSKAPQQAPVKENLNGSAKDNDHAR